MSEPTATATPISSEAITSNASQRGRFVWYDLMTTDIQAAIDFYTKVVGWGTQQWEGSSTPYTMLMVNGAPIGGVMALPPEMIGTVPPHWLGYVSVPSVDDSVRQAESLGGRVLAQATDIPDVGRFAVIADPQGASIAIFTPKDGSSRDEQMPNVGDVAWHELTATDHEAAFAFYQALFGWNKTSEFDMGAIGIYQMYGQGNVPFGGMWTKPKDMPVPPNWLYYIHVTNVDEAAERVKAHGGTILNEPMDVPGGDRVAQCMDPQGGMFALHASPAA